MSIQNVLTAALFKRDDAGRTVMYPNGIMGRGYVIADAATEQRMRRTLMWLIIASGCLGGVGMQVMLAAFGSPDMWTMTTWAITIGALALFGIGYYICANRLARGMTPAEQRMGAIEGLKRQAEAMPRWYLVVMTVFAGLLAAGSAISLAAGGSTATFVLGIIGMALFGAILVQAIYGLTRRTQA